MAGDDKHMLVIGGHIGDVENTGGLLACKYAQAGHRVTLLHMTAGEKGNPGRDTQEYREQRLRGDHRSRSEQRIPTPQNTFVPQKNQQEQAGEHRRNPHPCVHQGEQHPTATETAQPEPDPERHPNEDPNECRQPGDEQRERQDRLQIGTEVDHILQGVTENFAQETHA